MSPLPITTLLTSGLALWFLILTWRVIKGRQASGVSLGDGDNAMLIRRNRAQGNLVEFAPFFILLIALAELAGGNGLILSILSVAFFLARLAHGWALSYSDHSPAGRIGGASVTLITLALAALYNLWLVLG